MHVEAGKPRALADAVRLMCDYPDKRRQFAAASLAAAPRYSREVQAQEMASVLELVSAAHAGTGV